MAYMQNQPSIGKNCRSASARIAGPIAAPALHPPNLRTRSRLPLFAQFPPASLFKAIGLAVSRRAVARQVASGTAIANGRLWRVAGGP